MVRTGGDGSGRGPPGMAPRGGAGAAGRGGWPGPPGRTGAPVGAPGAAAWAGAGGAGAAGAAGRTGGRTAGATRVGPSTLGDEGSSIRNRIVGGTRRPVGAAGRGGCGG